MSLHVSPLQRVLGSESNVTILLRASLSEDVFNMVSTRAAPARQPYLIFNSSLLLFFVNRQ